MDSGALSLCCRLAGRTPPSGAHVRSQLLREQVTGTGTGWKSLNIQDPTWKVPKLVVPFQIPHPTSSSKEKVHKWLQQRGSDLALGPNVWDRLLAANTSDLVDWIYFDADEKFLPWLCKFMAATFVIDDALDDLDVETSKDLGQALTLILQVQLVFLMAFPEVTSFREEFQQFIDLLPEGRRTYAASYVELELAKTKTNGSVWDVNLEPIPALFRELWAEVMESGPAESTVRVARDMLRCTFTTVIERELRQTARVPSVAEYIELRRVSSCMLPFLSIVSLAYGSPIPDSVYYSPEMQLMLNATTDYVVLNNDVYSFSKEVIRSGNYLNLVYLISREQNCSLIEAGDRVSRLLSKKLDDIVTSAADLRRKASAQDRKVIELHIKACLNWCAGTNAWHLESERYHT